MKADTHPARLVGSDHADQAAGILAAALASRSAIRAAAEEIEQNRTLPAAIVQTLSEVGVFRMATPQELGGPELDPGGQFRVIEAIASADGSAGWCAYINSESGYYISRLELRVARAMYPSLDMPTGAMHSPTGRAEMVESGYRVTGRWSFCSGSMHSDWMVLACIVHDKGEPRRREDGSPVVISVFLAADEFEVLDTWHGMGLRGSGSHDVSATDVFVPPERAFDLYDLQASPPKCAGPLYAFRGMFLFNHCAVVVGIAQAAIDEFSDLASTKGTVWGPLRDQDYARTALSKATGLVGSARAYALSTLAEIYRTLLHGEELSIQQRAKYRIAMTHVHRAAVEAVDTVFEAAGSTPAVRLPSVLERCFRDVHTANQHLVVSPKSLREAGGMLLGQIPRDPQY